MLSHNHNHKMSILTISRISQPICKQSLILASSTGKTRTPSSPNVNCYFVFNEVVDYNTVLYSRSSFQGEKTTEYLGGSSHWDPSHLPLLPGSPGPPCLGRTCHPTRDLHLCLYLFFYSNTNTYILFHLYQDQQKLAHTTNNTSMSWNVCDNLTSYYTDPHVLCADVRACMLVCVNCWVVEHVTPVVPGGDQRRSLALHWPLGSVWPSCFVGCCFVVFLLRAVDHGWYGENDNNVFIRKQLSTHFAVHIYFFFSFCTHWYVKT